MTLVFTVLFALVAVVGAVWAHLVLWRARPLPEAAWLLLVLDTVIVLLVITALDWPLTFEEWMQEDGWVEWSTFYAFGLAALLRFTTAVGGWRQRTLPWVTALAWGLVGLFCLGVAGEEISWGQRIFAFKPPDVFLESNFQQELNVHNILKGKSLGSFKLESRYLVALIAGVYGVLLPGLLRLPALVQAKWAQLFRDAAPRPMLVPYFAAVAAVSLEYPVPLGGEAVEWVFGLTFLTDAALTWVERRTDAVPRRGWRLASVGATCLGLGLLTPFLLDHLVYGTDQERVARAKEEVAQLAADVVQARTETLLEKRRVHKRLFTAARDGYVRFGTSSHFLGQQLSPAEAKPGQPARNDRQGFFLDPWNNPYWVEARRKRDTVLVYSFGPNRRRDTPLDRSFKPDSVMQGDDVGIQLPLKRAAAQPTPEDTAPDTGDESPEK